jgi:cytochrome c-type biogenesis protein CcmH
MGAVAALLLVTASPAQADSLLPPAEYAYKQLPDPKQEAVARDLMDEVRCLVCQGQSIADSDADMAGDMRSHIRRRIAAGEAPDQVRAWLVERYGHWVTYDPPLDAVTWPLWAAPLVLVLGGMLLARGRFKRKAKA